MRDINEIILHTSATDESWMRGHALKNKVAEIRRWHTDTPPNGRGWRDIGYHFLIDLDGKVMAGRPLEQTGAHVKGRNTGTIGVCLIGKRVGKRTDKFLDNFTEAQEVAVLELIKGLHERFGALAVTGHNQYANKECPCFDVPKWWAEQNAPKITPAIGAGGGFAAILAGASGFPGLQPAAMVGVAVAGAMALYLILKRTKR